MINNVAFSSCSHFPKLLTKQQHTGLVLLGKVTSISYLTVESLKQEEERGEGRLGVETP